MRSAKIVCTLGPAPLDREAIRGFASTDMSAVRTNASHDNVEHRFDVIDGIHAVDDATDEPLTVVLDLQGSEVRIADIDEDIYLETGSEVCFYGDDEATPETVGLSYSATTAETGDTTLLDDGRIETTVEYVENDSVHTTIVSGGKLGSRKGVNVPGVDLDISLIIDSDYENLKLATRREVDYVIVSFIRDAGDAYTISDTLESLDAGTPITVKIGRVGAVDSPDGVIQVAYGVMVTRGGLGIECPLEKVPIIQKHTICKAQAAGVPIIITVGMLSSMVRSCRPTCTEAPDMANAVLDGTDAAMLSGETAVGDRPVRVVETMSRIVKEVEVSPEYDES